MSRGLIIDIIFNQDDEWDVDTIIDTLRINYKINVSVEAVEEVIAELESKGLIDSGEVEYCGGVVIDPSRCDRTIDLFGVAA